MFHLPDKEEKKKKEDNKKERGWTERQGKGKTKQKKNAGK